MSWHSMELRIRVLAYFLYGRAVLAMDGLYEI